MSSKECETQLNELLEAWDLDEATLNQTDIEAIKHLLLENQMQQDVIISYKTTNLDQAVDIQQLEQENKQLKERITYLENSNNRREETILNLRNEQQLDKYKEVIEEIREVIKNKMPYLYEIDKEYENVEGNTYFTYKEYDDSELLQILDKVKGE